MAVNAYGSHSFAAHNIGESINHVCVPKQRFVYLKQFYQVLQNGWMDSDGFKSWIEMCYGEVKEKSDCPYFKIIENCGGHELVVTLPGVHYKLLHPGSTAKCHPLDLGLIANRKIRFAVFCYFV